MQKFKILAAGLVLGLVSLAVYQNFFVRPAEAQKTTRAQWEYAQIRAAYSISPYADRLNRIYGMALICYMEAQGCKNSELKFELDYGQFLNDRAIRDSFDNRKNASVRASEIAFQRAVAQLGSDGWEMVTNNPELKFEFIGLDEYNRFDDRSVFFDRDNAKAVYFKRLKVTQ